MLKSGRMKPVECPNFISMASLYICCLHSCGCSKRGARTQDQMKRGLCASKILVPDGSRNDNCNQKVRPCVPVPKAASDFALEYFPGPSPHERKGQKQIY
uniref:Uncharacterized protein n=1 Tax=Trieres chinensis TaxID=1514140 RepID=A0A6U1T4H9_TRICV